MPWILRIPLQQVQLFKTCIQKQLTLVNTTETSCVADPQCYWRTNESLCYNIHTDTVGTAIPICNTLSPSHSPSQSPTIPLSGASAISAGWRQSCALLNTGEVKCWGGNSNGELGDGDTTESSIPVTVSYLSGATAISAGGWHSCALVYTGEVKCWGVNNIGELGDGMWGDSSIPVTVSNLSSATAISVGMEHTCALLSAGEVKCWGDNGYGELGDGNSVRYSRVPVKVSNLSGATAISDAGGWHSCALLDTDEVKCWGSNSDGQLGDGTFNDRGIPVKVSNLSGVTAISAGLFLTCALLNTSEVKCWGASSGDYTDHVIPVTVPNLSGATAISAGAYHACALLNTGEVKCWGENADGELGYGKSGAYAGSNIPVTVSNLSDATAIHAGADHTCALLNTGEVKCWGSNFYGQLGDGTTTVSSIPVTVVF